MSNDKMNPDVFKQPEEGARKTGSLPGFIPGMDKSMKGEDLSDYVCRVFRGNIGGTMGDDLTMIENILTRGLAGTGDIIIIDRTTQSFEDNYWIILTYLEKRAQ